MDIFQLCDCICQLNDVVTDVHSFSDQFEETSKILREKCNYDQQFVITNLSHIIGIKLSTQSTTEWDFIALSLFILQKMKETLKISMEEGFSVQQMKHLRNHLRHIVNIGICTKLLPNLPRHIQTQVACDNGDIFYNYNILKTVTSAICDLLDCPNMRLIILPDHLGPLLVACYQIAFCPLKRPSLDCKREERNTMTEQIYQQLIVEKQNFVDLLDHLQKSIHPGIFVKETMAIFYSSAPPWFKKSVSQNLTSVIKSKQGIENIAIALLDGATNDSTKTWNILDIISKLILSCKTHPDFKENIGNQLTKLLSRVTEHTLIYERIYTHCTKSLYKIDPELAKDVLVRPIVSFLLYFTYKSHSFEDNQNLTKELERTVRILHTLFIEKEIDLDGLPTELLTPAVGVLFIFFTLTLNTKFKCTTNELKDLLGAYLSENLDKADMIFDDFLFCISSDKILPIRNDIMIKISNEEIHLYSSEHSLSYSVSENADALLELLKSKTDMRVKFFGYLLNCLVNKEKYFKRASVELMSFEKEFMTEHLEKTLVVYKLLAELAEDKNIQNLITEEPEEILGYIDNVLKNSLELNNLKVLEPDTEAFHTLFTVLMILQNLVRNCSESKLENFKVLVGYLERIFEQTKDGEMQTIIEEILKILDEREVKSTKMFVEEIKTEFDKALEDICDPLLPIRGHGLMTLAKLVEKRDKSIMERKNYVLNIFQQNLKNEESYIYLNAINGLAALSEVFPDTVLNILCEEYSDSTRNQNEDGHEVRIKLGETLVRVTKVLGDMAPKYKSLLLNIFLNGAKDEDDLIRASSLANLGEICKVLGYKVGTIGTEVLACVHGVIATDKSPQSRRAAMSVLRQLFVGLESEMIAFLKDDILPIYRTLKEIYYNDKDDVMRLQAQLALEELNHNMKNFVFPNPQLNTEKKIIMLN